MLCLKELPEHSPVFRELAKAMSSLKFKVTTEICGAYHYVDTTSDWDTFYREFLNPNNKELLRQIRGAQREKFNLSVEKVSKNIYPAFESALAIYAKRRSSKGGYNPYHSEERRGFVKAVIHAFEKKGKVELNFLKDSDGNIWAFLLDWLHDGTRYHWNHAYNEEFKKYSPGKILIYMLMEEGFKDPAIRAINHMRGSILHKGKLANKSENLVAITIKNPYSRRIMGVGFTNPLVILHSKMAQAAKRTKR